MCVKKLKISSQEMKIPSTAFNHEGGKCRKLVQENAEKKEGRNEDK